MLKYGFLRFIVVVLQPVRNFPQKSFCNPNIELIRSLFFELFTPENTALTSDNFQCLSSFNDFAASSLFQLCSFVDLELDFKVELDVDDVAEIGG